MPKQIAVLFNNLMVQQIEAEKKNMTRRGVKGEALKWLADFTPEFVASPDNHLCPYGDIGDILWIREEHYRWGHWEKDGKTKKGAQKWKFVADSVDVLYYNNKPSSFSISRDKAAPELPRWYKRLGRFMPKSCCRYFLEVTGRKIEKLHDISEEDAKNEGVPAKCYEDFDGVFHAIEKETESKLGPCGSYQIGFKALWIKINGLESWEANDWVWCVSFKLKK